MQQETIAASPLDIPVRAQPAATENKMTFEHWWATLTTREQAQRTKEDFDEAWQAAFREGYEKGVAAFHEAVAMEREACAKVCENLPRKFRTEFDKVSDDCAAEIRKRSNAKVSGDGTASAGLPGYTAGDNTE